MSSINRREFPVCCAIQVLTDFGRTMYADRVNDMTDDEVVAAIREHERLCKSYGKALLMIALNNDQVTKYRKVLEAIGWPCILEEAYHPNHGTTVSIFAKVLQDDHYMNPKRIAEKRKENQAEIF